MSKVKNPQREWGTGPPIFKTAEYAEIAEFI